MATKTQEKLAPLVVTTLHKGVFFGYGVKSFDKTIALKDAQICVYWSADVRGISGLAATGPSNACKIGPVAPEIILQEVTAIFSVTPEAEQAWKKAGERKWA